MRSNIARTCPASSPTRLGGLTTRRTSNRKKKYHSGRGTYVVVVGFALGPSSAPSTSDIAMMTAITMHAIAESLATAYGKNGLPFDFRIAYSRRYSSFSRWFIAGLRPSPRGAVRVGSCGLDLRLAQLWSRLRLLPRGRGRAELGDQVQVRADQRRDRAGHEQHVDRVEARERRRAEFRAAAQEVAEVGPEQRAGAVDVHAHDRRPIGALVEREQVARE